MKSIVFSTLLLLTSTLAAPLTVVEKRNDEQIRSSMNRLTEATRTITTYLKARYHPNGKEAFFSEAIQRQNWLTRMTREETDRVNNAPELSSFEFYGLSSLGNTMADAVQETSDAWISLRDSSAPRDQEILSALQGQLSETLGYADAVWSKTNAFNRALTNNMRTKHEKIWNNAIKMYRSTPTVYGPNDFGSTWSSTDGGSHAFTPVLGTNYGGVGGGYQPSNQGNFGNNQGSFNSNPGSFTSNPGSFTSSPGTQTQAW